MEQNEHSTGKIDIELSDALAQGVYSNLAIINHSQGEFVVDYLSLMPGVPKARVVSRVVLTPVNAKKLLAALSDNLRRYESLFGEIRDAEVVPPAPVGQA